MNDVAEAVDRVNDAKVKVAEAEAALEDARGRLDQVLLDRGWQRLHGALTSPVYVRHGETVSLTEVIAREQEVVA